MVAADLDSAAAWIDEMLELPSDARWLLVKAGASAARNMTSRSTERAPGR